ncbi:adenosylcobinamide-GDP ribazoletransferase [Methylobacillus caricis]|uniref:adenosylcobinamide-GDP ribazoletransferase n=1 Tax=Methylobacillus caricis TaxID=1971611 RepID=UPI001CFF5948|nr:adenosylcobinamide-GDP ribazoletransferase [Methylobacillus caricis]MCB5188223.1 adenosylcobinamide-GDP ribazoletransferase [Methylobacillus caricis]
MKQQWRLLLLALGFFTRLPLPEIKDFRQSDLNEAARYFPLVGWLVGIVAAVAVGLLGDIVPLEVAIILSMMATAYLTGGFHEDGLADSVDGLGGGWEKEQALTIMKDSRLGSYGAMALVFTLLLKFESLLHISVTLLPLVLFAGHALSRLAAVLVIATQDYVRDEGKAKPLAHHLSKTSLLLAALFGLLPMLFLSLQLWAAMLPVAVVWIWFSLKLKKRLGGYTGDCLGAMQQLTEIAFYLGVLIWS